MEFVGIFTVLIGLGLVIYWVMTLVDVLKSEFKVGTNKIIWLLLIIFLGLIGSVLYTFIGKKQKIEIESNS